MKNKKYVVVISRIETRQRTVELDALNKESAEEAANDMAGDLDFRDGTSSDVHYEVEVVSEK